MLQIMQSMPRLGHFVSELQITICLDFGCLDFRHTYSVLASDIEFANKAAATSKNRKLTKFETVFANLDFYIQ